MLIAIIACEIGFWVAITLGLLARYPLNMPRLGLTFFLATPLIDLVLLALVIIQLRDGAEPHLTHGIAALYIGFSVAFGHRAIAWADRTYRRRIRKEPVVEPQHGSKLRREIESFVRAVIAAAIAVGVLELAIIFAANPAAAETLRQWHNTLLMVLFIWFITGPVWQFFTPAKKSAHMPSRDQSPHSVDRQNSSPGVLQSKHRQNVVDDRDWSSNNQNPPQSSAR